MKRYLGFVITALFFAAPMLVAQESNMDHVELGAFVNYYRLIGSGSNQKLPRPGWPGSFRDSTQHSTRSRNGLRFQARLHQHLQQRRQHVER